MTTYPELMELLSGLATNEIYEAVSDWYREREGWTGKWNEFYSKFIEDDIYLLYRDELPKPDDQGAYLDSYLVNFLLKFKLLYELFDGERDKL